MRRQLRSGLDDLCPEVSERGATLAEFALVLPVLLMIVFGIIEFGFAFSRSQAVEAAAREGARLASISATTNAELTSRVQDALGPTNFDGAAQVSVIPANGCSGRQGLPVTVVVSAPHRVTIPFVVDRQLTLSGRAVFRCEA